MHSIMPAGVRAAVEAVAARWSDVRGLMYGRRACVSTCVVTASSVTSMWNPDVFSASSGQRVAKVVLLQSSVCMGKDRA